MRDQTEEAVEEALEWILEKFAQVDRKVEKTMADLAALDSAIANLKTAVDAIVAKVETIPNAPDFTPEIGQIQAAADEINNALAPPAPAPAPAPAETPPPDSTPPA